MTVTQAATGPIDPATLLRIRSLELRAKSIVEGFRSGLNRSPWHGFSVEFSEYREYCSGDDLRYLDWKLYARSDRLYIKQFQDETNLCCQILLDMSRSMAFGSTGYSKADYARTLTATFGYFLMQQRDSVGLIRFSSHIESRLPARHRVGQLRRFLAALEPPPAGEETHLQKPLRELAEQLRRRGLVVLISDFLTNTATLKSDLALLKAAGHDVLVFHLVDPGEESLSFTETTVLIDAETGQKIAVDPATAGERYRERFAEHTRTVKVACEQLGIDYRYLKTSEPFETAFAEFLRQRMQQGNGRPVRRAA